ncbi:MAG: hypothetical protein AB4368_16280 [Xenococcaceae cyanobacterium]
MNKFPESQIFVVTVSLLVLLNNFIWSLEEKGSIDIVDYQKNQLQVEKRID